METSLWESLHLHPPIIILRPHLQSGRGGDDHLHLGGCRENLDLILSMIMNKILMTLISKNAIWAHFGGPRAETHSGKRPFATGTKAVAGPFMNQSK